MQTDGAHLSPVFNPNQTRDPRPLLLLDIHASSMSTRRLPSNYGVDPSSPLDWGFAQDISTRIANYLLEKYFQNKPTGSIGIYISNPHIGGFLQIIIAKAMGVSIPLFTHFSDAVLERHISHFSPTLIITENDQQKEKFPEICKNSGATIVSLSELFDGSLNTNYKQINYRSGSPQFIESIIRLLIAFPDKRIAQQLIGQLVRLDLRPAELHRFFSETRKQLADYQIDIDHKPFSRSLFESKPIAITDVMVLDHLEKRLFSGDTEEKKFTLEAVIFGWIGKEASALLQFFAPESALSLPQDTIVSQEHVLSGLEAHTKMKPHNIAIRCPNNKTISYEVLHEKTNQLANYLVSHGLIKKNPVGIYLTPSPEMIIAVIAVIKAGGMILPLDPEESDEITLERFKQLPPSFIIARTTSDLRKFKRMLTLSETPVELVGLDEIETALSECARETPERNTESDYPVYGSFDKGGFPCPQPVPIFKSELQKMIRDLQRFLQLTPSDRIAQFNAISSENCLMEILVALNTGACLVPVDSLQRQYRHKLYTYYDIQQITIAVFPSQLLVTLDENELSTVRSIVADNTHLTEETKALFCSEGGKPRTFAHFADCCISTGVYLFSTETNPLCFPVTSETTYVLQENDEVLIPHKKLNFRHPRYREQNQAVSLLRTYQRGKLAEGKLVLLGTTGPYIYLTHTALNLDYVRFFLLRNPAIQQIYPVGESAHDTPGTAEITLYIELKPHIIPDAVTADLLMWNQFFSRTLPESIRLKQWIFVNKIYVTERGEIDVAHMEKILTAKNFLSVIPIPAVQRAYPETTLEKTLQKAWQDALGYLYPISLSMPLPQLGATLTTWRTVCSTLADTEEWGALSDMESHVFQAAPTLRAMLRFVAQRTDELSHVKTLVLAKSDNSASASHPCFMIPSFMGTPQNEFKELIKHWKKNRSLFSFDFSALCNAGKLPESIAEFAEEIIRAIQETQPDGPYLISSYGNASTAIAVEVVFQLEAKGHTAGLVPLLSSAPGSWQQQNPQAFSHYLSQKYAAFCREQKIAKRPPFPEGKMPREQIDIICQALQKISPKNQSLIFLMQAMLLAEFNYMCSLPVTHARYVFVNTETMDTATYLNSWQEEDPARTVCISCTPDNFLETPETREALQTFLTELEVDFKTIAINEQLRRRYTSETFASIHRLFADKAHALAPIDEAFTEVRLFREDEASQNKKPSEENSNSTEQDEQGEDNRLPVYLHHLFEHSTPGKVRRILVLGKPGTGKTTLAQRIVYLHANRKLFNHLFEAILLFKLRRFTSVNYDPRKKYTLADIVERECFDQTGTQSAFSQEDLTAYLRNLKGRVCILLEGLDELPEHSPLLPLISDLLNDPNIYIIAFARPEARFRTQEVAFDVTLENTGFADQNIPEYVRQYYAKDKDGAETARKVINYLTKNASLYGLAHYPLYLELICTIWDDQLEKELSAHPLTQTRLCEKIQEKLWKRYFERLGHHDKSYLKDKQKINRFLERIAFVAMQQHQVVISNTLLTKIAKEIYSSDSVEKDEDVDFIIDDILAPGFLASSDNDKDLSSKNYFFLHYSLHEFFAAQYFVKWFTNPATRLEAAAFLESYKYHPRYQLFWQFVAGLFASQHLDMLQPFFDALCTGQVDLVGIYHLNVLVRCLEEVQGAASVTQYDSVATVVQRLIEKNGFESQLFLALKNSPYLLRRFKVSEQLQAKIQNKKHSSQESFFLDDTISMVTFSCRLVVIEKPLIDCMLNYFAQTTDSEKIEILKAFRKLRQHQTAVTDFMTDYLTNSNTEVRAHVHWLVGKLQQSTPTLTKALQSLAASSSDSQAAQAIKTLGEIGQAQPAVVEVIKRKLFSSSNSDVKLACLTALCQLRPLKTDSVFVIEQMIMDPDPAIRKNAIALRAKLPAYSKRFVALLITSLFDNVFEVSGEAAKTLSILRKVNPTLLASLCRKFDEPQQHPLMRRNILNALSSLLMLNRHLPVPPQVLAIFHKAFWDPDYAMFNHIVRFGPLGIIPHHQFIRLMLEAIAKKHVNMMQSFQLRGTYLCELSAEGEALLREARLSADADVRTFATHTLLDSERVDEVGMRFLEAQLNSENPFETGRAASVLCKQLATHPNSVALLSDALRDPKKVELAEHIIETLGKLDENIPEGAIKLLCQTLQSRNEKLFSKSITALHRVCRVENSRVLFAEITRTVCGLIPHQKDPRDLYRLLNAVASPAPELFDILKGLFHTLKEEHLKYKKCIRHLREVIKESDSAKTERNALWKSTEKKRPQLVNILCTLFKNWNITAFIEYLRQFEPDSKTLKSLCGRLSIDVVFQFYLSYPRKAFLKTIVRKLYGEHCSAVFIANNELCCFDPVFRLAISDAQTEQLRKEMAIAFDEYAKLKPEFLTHEQRPIVRGREPSAPLPTGLPLVVKDQRQLAVDQVRREKLKQLGDQVRQTGKRTIFISHAWQLLPDEDKKFNLNEQWANDFVKQLAEDLALVGFTVILDFNDLGSAVHLNRAMQDSVEEANYILILATRTYFHKLHDRVFSGVGKELNLIATRVNALTPQKAHEMRLLHCFNFVGKFPPTFTLFEAYDGFAAIGINEMGYLSALLELPEKIAGVKSDLVKPAHSNAALISQLGLQPHKNVARAKDPGPKKIGLKNKAAPKANEPKRPLPPPPSSTTKEAPPKPTPK